jgi:hypothetical protein
MKIFLSLFVLFWIGFFALNNWAGGHAMPVPGGGPTDVDPYENIAGHIVVALIYPAMWCGQAAIFVGPALWAVLFSTIFTFLWRSYRVRKIKDKK